VTNPQTQTQEDIPYREYTIPSGDWHRDYEAKEPEGGLLDLVIFRNANLCRRTTETSGAFIIDAWLIDECTEVKTYSDRGKPLLISDLGWTREETLETYYRVRTFKEDWETPGMEDYDEL
jgi:hypothetical protein